MRHTKISLDVFGDRLPWEHQDMSEGDNSESMAHMQRAAIKIINNELTDCQRSVVYAYYFDNKTVTSIADELGVCKSTVSRHLSRGLDRLRRCLVYGYFH